jgi:hypothetical protein
MALHLSSRSECPMCGIEVDGADLCQNLIACGVTPKLIKEPTKPPGANRRLPTKKRRISNA